MPVVHPTMTSVQEHSANLKPANQKVNNDAND